MVSKKEKIDLCVFSFKSDGTLKNSRPCFFCLKSMLLWNIKNIYFSNSEGGVTKTTVSDLLSQTDLNIITYGERNRKKNLD